MKEAIFEVFKPVMFAASLCVALSCADDEGDQDANGGDGDGDGDGTGTGDGDGDGDGTGDGDGDGDGTGACAAKGDTGDYVLIDSNIDEDTTWTCDRVYVLGTDSHVFVNDATLTIEPGTTVLGSSGSALVIEKSAALFAEGTEDAPIVLTSFQDSPARGDWGGLVFLGSAVANVGQGQAEGFANAPTYGGNDEAHDCGSIAYLRVEWAGYAISDGNELNGITFYACGTDTSVHHVQVHMGQDDGIEMFGGGFEADHIVVTGAADDSLDIDQGFQGTLQHVFVLQDPVVGDNAFEISNQGTDFTATPINSPTICNATVIGSGGGGEKSKGFTLKEGTEAALHSVIFSNATHEAGLITNAETQAIAESGGIVVANNLFFGNGSPQFVADTDGWVDADWEAWVLDPANANLQADPGLADTSWSSPDITPGAAVAGAGAVPSACESTDWIGAVEPGGDNWTTAAWIVYEAG